MRVRLQVVALAFSAIAFSTLAGARQQTWVEVRSPNFIVVSNAGEKQARKAAVQFEQIRTVFQQSLTVAQKHPSPVITVLAVKDEASMRDLLPEYWAKGHSHPAGYFAGQLNQFFAAVQLDAQGSNPYETFYHEYYHTISVPYVPSLPLWLAEGLAEFFGHTTIEEKSVSMGDADALLIEELRANSLIPLETLFQVDRNSPYYNETNKTSIFYAESWALAHYLMIGDRIAHKPMLTAYLDAMDQGKSAIEAASIAFGDLKKLDNDLRSYIRQSSYYHLKFPSPQFNEDEMKVRTLSEAEAEAYRGGFAAVCGRSQDAAAKLNDAIKLDPNVALSYEYLGLSELTSGQRDKAIESTSKAIELDPNNSFTRYLRAFLKTGGSGFSSDPQTEEDLRQAIASSPNFAPPYGLLAMYLASSDKDLDEALGFAKKAISFEPANSNFQLALAQVLVRQKKIDEADLAARRASAWAREPAEKANAENFRQFLVRYRELQTDMGSNGAPRIVSGEGQNGESVPDGDRPVLKFRTAGDSAPANAANPYVASVLRVQSNITMMGSPMGVDFTPYFKDLVAAIQNHLMASVGNLRLGDAKNVTLELAVSKDGSISGITIAASSGNDVLDKSTVAGIVASAPLPVLPSGYKGRSLKVRLKFSFSEEQN